MEILDNYLIVRKGNLNCIPHVNPELEVICVKKGSLTVRYDDAMVEVGENEAALVLPYRLHGVTQQEGTEAFVLMFAYSFSADVYDNYKAVDMKNYKFTISEELRLYMEGAIKQVQENMNVFTIKSLYYPLVSAYLKDNEMTVSKRHSADIIRKVVMFIAENSTEDITIDDVAEAVGEGREKISAILKERSGRSFNDFLNIVRLEKARRIIEFTDQSISEIAYYCGFGSLRNFNRVYRKVFGESPSSERARG